MAQALTKVEHGVPVTEIAADLKVSLQAVYKLMKAANGLKKALYRSKNLALEGNGKRRVGQIVFKNKKCLPVHQSRLLI